MKAESLANSLQRLPVPKSYRKARVSPDWETKWKPAFDKQYKYLQDRSVWTLEELPHDAKLLPGKWVLDEKKLPTGELVGRARWEHDSWAVQDVYAAVASTTSVKIFLIWTAILDLECYQFDIATAFLNADIPEGTNIYVMQPEGYEDGTSRVCLLKKALYGLRKSPLWWFLTITPILKTLGFEPLDADLCLFKDEKRGCILILYVDDMLVAAPTKETVFHVKEQLQSFFELSLAVMPKKLDYGPPTRKSVRTASQVPDQGPSTQDQDQDSTPILQLQEETSASIEDPPTMAQVTAQLAARQPAILDRIESRETKKPPPRLTTLIRISRP
ncbi:reverse transcriptase (RNA-dependent DNA polymerase) [Hirsutella rhossiliensis]|uniref:Reverse transcriptase (RNA-dependent DNA polymerase) domain-containing protein n=1 Tax=Hirsutella rhossiliensis TaxID=111463 RepID=A0A9P8MVB8_9HYPO|nr:reverse transcriptase (RNA-dependent DNA polymerase) domain-containing protein [Hirsutella rhossiliensis]KAH0962072.1 reverse transcriptase (RNA-dependent DNA polymerase) domain-containing protein [Hirsutella rhossiliensis]